MKTGFDVARGERTGFTFSVEAEPERVTQIKLEGMTRAAFVADFLGCHDLGWQQPESVPEGVEMGMLHDIYVLCDPNEGIGPKLLVSDVTTEEVPILRWRLELKGNNAVEFGTVPIALQVCVYTE